MTGFKVEGEQNSLFPVGPAIKCSVNTSQLKNTTNCTFMAKKSYAFDAAGHKFAPVSRDTI